MPRGGSAPAPLVGRRVGGGFEIDCIIAAQREEAARIQARKERESRIRIEQATYTAAAAADALNNGNEELAESTSHFGGSPPLGASPRGASLHSIDTQHAGSAPLVPPTALRTIRTPIPKPQQRLTASQTQSVTAVTPLDAAMTQKRRQTCQQMGFPTLWSYAQTRVACEELSRGIGEMAFAHGGEKVFASPAVLQTYKELQLSCLQDPLLAPMVTRIQKFHERGSNKSSHQSSPARPTNESFTMLAHGGDLSAGAGERGADDDVEEDDRLGVERFALPPNELSEDMDPILGAPVDIPVADALETVLAFSTLSTAGERRAIKGAPLTRLHQKRCAALFSLLLPSSSANAFRGIVEPTDNPLSVPSDQLEALPSSATEAIRLLFWFMYYAFFLPEKVEMFAWRIFPLLSESLMAIQLQAVTLRNHRLNEAGEPTSESTIGCIEHTNNKSEPLDFLPFVLVHTVCFLFPAVFPASHDLFTVDFFNRASMLMHLIMTGVDSDAQYWVAIRQAMFSAPQTRVEDIAVAAEVARMESNRLLQGYQDDIQQLRKMKDAFDKKQVDRTEAMLRAAEGKPTLVGTSAAAGSGQHREAMLRRMERRSIAGNVRASSLYCPPLDTIELGDPLLHLLNDSVFDPEYAQDVMRNRQVVENYGRSGTSSEAAMFRPRTKEEAHKFHDAIVNKKFYGHLDAMRAATCMEVHERYRPSVYPPSHIPDQSIMERNIATLRQQIAEEESKLQLRNSGGPGVSGSSSATGADGEDETLTGGFVVRFTPLGVRCSPQAEELARSFRVISASDAQQRVLNQRRSARSRGPLQRSGKRPVADTPLAMQLSMFNGPPNVVDAVALTKGFKEPIRQVSPQRLSGVLPPLAAEDPALEEATHVVRNRAADVEGAVFGDMLRTTQFGNRVKSFVTVRSPSATTEASEDSMFAGAPIDEEASAAVHVIADVLFPRGVTLGVTNSGDEAGSLGGVEHLQLDDAASHVQAVGRRNKIAVMKTEALNETQRDAPLALKSFLSLKRHESVVLSQRPKSDVNQRTSSPPQTRGAISDALSATMPPLSQAPAHNASMVRQDLSTLSTMRRSVSVASTSIAPSTSPPDREARTVSPHNNSKNISSLSAIPQTRRSATPSSRPNGTLITNMNSSAMSPSSASIMHQQTVGEPRAWRGMTYAVKRTQKYIDDAVRIHNAQCEIKDMVSAQFERQRETDELRKRASDRTFDDEMAQLRSRITDPLQRSVLVNDWIEREPSRRLPDRDKHAALLRGTLLAEEAQHTGMMVREGLRKLEITFARRRKQSRMRKL